MSDEAFADPRTERAGTRGLQAAPPASRRGQCYPHRPWRWLGIFDNAPMYFGFRAAFGVANLGLGR